jgi:hypothetical protein
MIEAPSSAPFTAATAARDRAARRHARLLAAAVLLLYVGGLLVAR